MYQLLHVCFCCKATNTRAFESEWVTKTGELSTSKMIDATDMFVCCRNSPGGCYG